MDVSEKAADAEGVRYGISFCALAIALILIGIVITYWWVICAPHQSRFLGAGDCWSYYGPALHYMDNRIHNGEFPLWNPLYLCGQPHAANMQSWVFYPPNLIRSLLTFHPTPWKTHVGIALMIGFHLLLGGIGMLFLARGHGLSFGASLVASFGFTFSAALVTRAIGHWIFLNTACWLPFLLLLARAAFFGETWRGKIGNALGAGVVLGMAILGGVPNLILLVGLTVVVYLFLLRLLYPQTGIIFPEPAPPKGVDRKTTASFPRKRESRTTSKKTNHRPSPLKAAAKPALGRRMGRILLQDGALWTLLFATGVLVAAPLLLPALEFAGVTNRGDKSSIVQEDLAHVQGVWNYLKILIIYQGHGHYEAPRAAGAGVFFLALASVFHPRRRQTALFLALFLVLLDCSLSEPLLFGRLINWLAPYKISNPGRAMILTCLPLAMLAGVGTDAVMASLASLRAKLIRSAVLAALGVAVVLVVALAARPEPVLPVGPVVIVIPAVLCAVAVLAGWIHEPILFGSIIAMLLLGETLAWNKQLLPSILPEQQRYPDSMETLEQPQTFWNGNHRGTASRPNVPLYELKPAINGYDPLEIKDVCKTLCTTNYKTMFRRCVFAEEVTSFNLRGNTFLKRSFWLARQYARGPLPDMHVPYPVATTVFLEKPGPLPLPEIDAKSVAKTGVSEHAKRVPLLTTAMPAAVLRSEEIVGDKALQFREVPLPPYQSSLFITATATADVLIKPIFQEPKSGREEWGQLFKVKAGAPARTHELALPDFQAFRLCLSADFKEKKGTCTITKIELASDQDDEDRLIHVAARTANTVDADIDPLPDARILLFVDAYYPGWKAYVDGKPVPIYKANDAFKAVLLPKGGHHVRFVFTSWRVWVGVVIACVTLTGAAAIIFFARGKSGALLQ